MSGNYLPGKQKKETTNDQLHKLAITYKHNLKAVQSHSMCWIFVSKLDVKTQSKVHSGLKYQ